MEELPRRGIRIITEKVFTRIEKTTSGLVGHITGGQRLEADQIMFAIGRSPNTTGLGLDMAGVELTRSGAVKVDGNSRTNVESIYAIGDVTDRVALTPVAIREGHAFADTLFGGKPWSTDYEMIPSAVFATPELGTVGLTEAEARAAHPEVDIYKARFRPMKGTLSGREERMLMKLVVEARSGQVLGCHIIGPDAGEMVQIAAIAMRMGATKADFDRTMALHPTAAEELVTMREKWTPPPA
jgi:glutathione reductase (NADPH)